MNLPVEMIELCFAFSGMIGVWKIFNERYLGTNLPKYLCDVMEKQRLKNYFSKNYRIVFLDFFTQDKFDLYFADNVMLHYYLEDEYRKCLTVFMIIMNHLIFYTSEREAIKYGKIICFYDHLKNFVYNELVFHVKRKKRLCKKIRYRPYLYFPNITDLEKFVLFLEISEFFWLYMPFFRFQCHMYDKKVYYNGKLTPWKTIEHFFNPNVCDCNTKAIRDPDACLQINQLLDEIHREILHSKYLKTANAEKNYWYRFTTREVRRTQCMYFKYFIR